MGPGSTWRRACSRLPAGDSAASQGCSCRAGLVSHPAAATLQRSAAAGGSTDVPGCVQLQTLQAVGRSRAQGRLRSVLAKEAGAEARNFHFVMQVTLPHGMCLCAHLLVCPPPGCTQALQMRGGRSAPQPKHSSNVHASTRPSPASAGPASASREGRPCCPRFACWRGVCASASLAARVLVLADLSRPAQVLEKRGLIVQHPFHGSHVDGAKYSMLVHLTRFAPTLRPGEYLQVRGHCPPQSWTLLGAAASRLPGAADEARQQLLRSGHACGMTAAGPRVCQTTGAADGP